ncbi:MAG TPA: hypothetical protein VLC98_05770 [Phnomibacter sp.]|nr:hypothetical protein [Phnomibacter sp.]
MARINSKSKGNTFEREVAKFLSDTYKQKFIRVPNSGAYVGGKNISRKAELDSSQVKLFKSDIIPPDGWCLNVECKSYTEFQFNQLFEGESRLLDQWINQTLMSASDDDVSIILMKFNRIGRFVCVRSDAFYLDIGLKYKDWWFTSWEQFFIPTNIDILKTLAISP